MADDDRILNELKKQTTIFEHLYDKSLYSNAPFASLLMSEVSSYEDMDGNDLIFGTDFIFDVPFSHLSPMLQNVCQMIWGNDAEEDYTHFLANPGDKLMLFTFEQYRDGLVNEVLKQRVDSYIVNYKRILNA